MQDSRSSVGRVASQKTYEILKRAFSAFPGAHYFFAHYALSFEYVCGSVFVRKYPSNYVESVVVYDAREDASAEGRDSAGSGVQRQRA